MITTAWLQGWIVCGKYGEVVGPQMDGDFVVPIFLSPDDAEAALKKWDIPPGCRVIKIDIVPSGKPTNGR